MKPEHDAFHAIDAAVLDAVTGGRHTHGPVQIDPALIQGIGQLAQAVQGVGQNLAQAKSASDQGMMQMMQQMMQAGPPRR
jgi:hypothetical protein